MSYATLIMADHFLPESPWPDKDYPLEINVDTRTIYDGDADDNFALLKGEVPESFDSAFAVALCWNYYTPGRAEGVIAYIEEALCKCKSVDVWKIWYFGPFEDIIPTVEERVIPISQLKASDIQFLDEFEVFHGPHNEKATFYCLKVVK